MSWKEAEAEVKGLASESVRDSKRVGKALAIGSVKGGENTRIFVVT